MKLIISCIIGIVGKLLIVIGILFFLLAVFLGVVAPPWFHWLGEASFLIRISVIVISGGLVAFIVVFCGLQIAHFADRFIEKH